MKRTLTIILSLALPLAANAQRLAVSTDLLGWACLVTPNASVQYALHQHWSVEASAGVNAWSLRTGGDFGTRQSSELKARQQTVCAGVRWWQWNVYSGWWAGLKAQVSEYDDGGVGFIPWLRDNESGFTAGAVLSAGYAWQLSENWDIDVSAGLWGGYRRYTTYGCSWCGPQTGGGSRAGIMPSAVQISLLHVF